MNEITVKYMKKLGNIMVNSRGNQDIYWHAGRLPPGIPNSIFVGNANGNTVQLNIAESPNITAAQVIAAMKAHIVQQCRVRVVRCRHEITGNAAPAGVKFDDTRVGMTNRTATIGELGDTNAPFGANDDISLDSFTDYYDKLYKRYVAVFRTAPLYINHVVCHGSCHSNCHYARGRR